MSAPSSSSSSSSSPATAPAPAYDPDNIFARILRGEIPNDTVADSEHTLAFRDIRPQAPVHLLVIPKGAYVDYADFCSRASEAELVDFARTLARVAAEAGVSPAAGGAGFRAITNAGPDGVQEVPHFHMHVLGGGGMGRMVSRNP